MIDVVSTDIGGTHIQTLEVVVEPCLADLHEAQKVVELTVINYGLGGINEQGGMGRIHK